MVWWPATEEMDIRRLQAEDSGVLWSLASRKDGPKMTGMVAKEGEDQTKSYIPTVTGALFTEIGFEIGSRDVFWVENMMRTASRELQADWNVL